MSKITRKKKTIRLNPELLEWVETQTEKGRFWHLSHAVEVALQKLRDAEKEN